jgi:urease accessory protein
MDASTQVEVGVDERGHSVVRRLRCEAPMLVRVIDDDLAGVTLAIVNGAAGPLGGDRLAFALHVGAGATVTVRSVAAAMALPGPCGGSSTLSIDLVVGDDASLDWAPQPMVSVAGSDHRTIMHLSATASSKVRMSEGVSLGRHGEPPGRLALRQRVVIDEVSVLDHETVFAPGELMGPGAHGSARTLTSTVTIAAEPPPAMSSVTACAMAATYHVSPGCALSLESR